MTAFRWSIALLGIVLFTLIAVAVVTMGLALSGKSRGATVGGIRNSQLIELSQRYVSQNRASSSIALKAGESLAPVPFLNEELQKSGAKWRVHSTDGLEAETYDVS